MFKSDHQLSEDSKIIHSAQYLPNLNSIRVEFLDKAWGTIPIENIRSFVGPFDGDLVPDRVIGRGHSVLMPTTKQVDQFGSHAFTLPWQFLRVHCDPEYRQLREAESEQITHELFGRAIWSYRRGRDLTVREVSDLSGVAVETITAIENTKKLLPQNISDNFMQTVELIAKELGSTPKDILNS